jgi:hypothetical protein
MVLVFSIVAKAQPSLNDQVSETVKKVGAGKSSTERSLAAMHLCEITRGDASNQVDDQSLLAVEGLLKINDDSVRYWVALCLGNFGPRAKAAVPKLLEILDQTDCIKAAKTSASGIRVALKKIDAEVPPSKCD